MHGTTPRDLLVRFDTSLDPPSAMWGAGGPVIMTFIFNSVAVTPGGNSMHLGGRRYHFNSTLRVEIMLPAEYR